MTKVAMIQAGLLLYQDKPQIYATQKKEFL
jgi:hypothetical protein